MRLLPRCLFIALGLAVAAPALAQTAPVGRISLVAGHATLRPAGNTSGWAAEVNDPVATGSAIETDSQGRVELRIGADAIQLAGNTVLDIARLDDRVVQLVLKQGRIALRRGKLEASDTVEIDLPRGGLWLMQPGAYDIDAGAADRPTRIAAFDGSARFVGSGADVAVKPGERAVLNGAKPVSAAVEKATPDDFAAWWRAREDGEGEHLSAAYFVSPEMTGSDTLDANGNWEGGVWYPRSVPADWAPYRFGKWRWMTPWGWTWIDDAPWGFAPTHYGRWTDIANRWGWVPGAYAAHPLYAPALVAFLGTPGVGLSFAEGHGPAIGWFPLAPGEVYWPSYTADLRYIRQLNQPNVRDVEAIRLGSRGELPLEVFDAHFANRGAATVVPRSVFAGGGAVTTARLQLPEQRLLDAPVIMGSPQIAATAAPVVVAGAPPRKPEPAAATKQVVVLRGRGGAKPADTLIVATHPRAPALVVTSASKFVRTVKLRTGGKQPAATRSAGMRVAARAGRTRKLRR